MERHDVKTVKRFLIDSYVNTQMCTRCYPEVKATQTDQSVYLSAKLPRVSHVLPDIFHFSKSLYQEIKNLIFPHHFCLFVSYFKFPKTLGNTLYTQE